MRRSPPKNCLNSYTLFVERSPPALSLSLLPCLSLLQQRASCTISYSTALSNLVATHASPGIATVVGAIGARVIIGAICDTVGPRMATAGVLLLIAPPVFCASLIVDRGGIIAVRFFIGIGLCIFVCNQFWAGTMFSPNCVGTVNATCGGWGNLGGKMGCLGKQITNDFRAPC